MRLSIGLLALAVAVSASPAVYTVKERANIPRSWTKRSPAPADHVMYMRIALPQPNFGTLEGHLREISDPSHARYSEHLTKEEVEELSKNFQMTVNTLLSGFHSRPAPGKSYLCGE